MAHEPPPFNLSSSSPGGESLKPVLQISPAQPVTGCRCRWRTCVSTVTQANDNHTQTGV
jgi:hypothetical protein